MSKSHTTAIETSPPLPPLPQTPSHHPSCCLSLSHLLIQTLSTLFSSTSTPPLNNPVHKPKVILSIGSGTGLLEAHLNTHLSNLSKPTDSTKPEPEAIPIKIEGVEVCSTTTVSPSPSPSPSTSNSKVSLNAYLPEELTNTVNGTWAICPRLDIATGLMFVYPRDMGLIERYLAICALPQSKVDVVVWLGPKMDWGDYESKFRVEGFEGVEVVDGCGLVEYEMMAVLKRRTEI